MRITFLGTGTSQGIPIIGSKHPVCLSDDPKDKRLRTSVMIEWADSRYIIDCGPDFRQQMLANQVDKIDGILFTHEHTDHVIGFDDIRPFCFRQGAIPVYAQPRVIDALKQRFDYIFKTKNKYPGAPAVMINSLSGIPFKLGDHQVTPIKVQHGKLPIYGYRFGDFTYITDAKTVPTEELYKFEGTRVLVVNTVRRQVHHSHFNLAEALAFIKKVNPEKAYLTHISHHLGFHKKVEKELPNHIHLAYDNLKIEI